MTLKVLFLTGHSAESQLSAPIIRRMQADPYFDVFVADVRSSHELLCECHHDCQHDMSIKLSLTSCDIVISPCDRVEMLTPTYAAFLANKPIVRIYGGIAGSGTHDDSIRHALDCFGHIHCVESEECKSNLIKSGEEEWRIHVTGITHLDLDEEFDYSCVPDYQYALWLMNPVTISEEATAKDFDDALYRLRSFLNLQHPCAVILPPNGDKYSEIITNRLEAWLASSGWERKGNFIAGVRYYRERLPRAQFLGLLKHKNCQLYISNSSSTTYEAPALREVTQNWGGFEIFNPSWRNAERTKPPKLEAGGSDKIINVLKSIDWSEKEKLLRKRFRF